MELGRLGQRRGPNVRGVRPALVYLIGHPAAGKYTIAQALAEEAAARGHRMVVVDNHHINNTIFGLLDVDGIRALPSRVWEIIADVRRAALTAIEELGPPDWSYVFTNVLVAGDAEDEKIVRRLADLAHARASVYVPVRLLCDIDELSNRVVSPERRTRLKWMDPVGLRAFASTHDLVDISGHPAALDLDVTYRQPTESAIAILDHLTSSSIEPEVRP